MREETINPANEGINEAPLDINQSKSTVLDKFQHGVELGQVGFFTTVFSFFTTHAGRAFLMSKLFMDNLPFQTYFFPIGALLDFSQLEFALVHLIDIHQRYVGNFALADFSQKDFKNLQTLIRNSDINALNINKQLRAEILKIDTSKDCKTEHWKRLSFSVNDAVVLKKFLDANNEQYSFDNDLKQLTPGEIEALEKDLKEEKRARWFNFLNVAAKSSITIPAIILGVLATVGLIVISAHLISYLFVAALAINTAFNVTKMFYYAYKMVLEQNPEKKQSYKNKVFANIEGAIIGLVLVGVVTALMVFLVSSGVGLGVVAGIGIAALTLPLAYRFVKFLWRKCCGNPQTPIIERVGKQNQEENPLEEAQNEPKKSGIPNPNTTFLSNDPKGDVPTEKFGSDQQGGHKHDGGSGSSMESQDPKSPKKELAKATKLVKEDQGSSSKPSSEPTKTAEQARLSSSPYTIRPAPTQRVTTSQRQFATEDSCSAVGSPR